MTVIEAIRSNDVVTLASLLKAGADPNEADEDGKPAIYLATEERYLEAVRLLLEAGGQVNARYGSEDALKLAASQGNLALVRLLLAHGADCSLRDSAGETALFAICQLGQEASEESYEIATLLLEHGADVNLLNTGKVNIGIAAIAYAAHAGNRRLVDLLLNAGADPNASGAMKDTPLMWAADGGKAHIMERLIAAGADVNAQDTQTGYTPLMYAVQWGGAKAVRALLAHGAVSGK